jgi:hypothetical protein
MGAEVYFGLMLASAVGLMGAESHKEYEKEKAEKKQEEINKSIEKQNELIRKKNSKKERIKRVMDNQTDLSTGINVDNLFKVAQNKQLTSNRQGDGTLFGNKNKHLNTSKTEDGTLFGNNSNRTSQ